MLNRFQQGGWRRQRQRTTSSSSSPRSQPDLGAEQKKWGCPLRQPHFPDRADGIGAIVLRERRRSFQTCQINWTYRNISANGVVLADRGLPEPWICRSISANGATPSVLSIDGTIGPSAPCVDADWSVRTNIFTRDGRLALEIAQRVFSSPSQPHFSAASAENGRITLLQGRHGMQHRTAKPGTEVSAHALRNAATGKYG